MGHLKIFENGKSVKTEFSYSINLKQWSSPSRQFELNNFFREKSYLVIHHRKKSFRQLSTQDFWDSSLEAMLCLTSWSLSSFWSFQDLLKYCFLETISWSTFLIESANETVKSDASTIWPENARENISPSKNSFL